MSSMADDTMSRFQVSGKVKVVKGSILTPQNAGLRLVLSFANMAGKADGPLFALFDKKWRKVKEEVKGWYVTKNGAYKPGILHTTAVQSDVWVLSMLCKDDQLVTDAKALESCLKAVAKTAKDEKASVHISTLLVDAEPLLAGLVESVLVKAGVSVYYVEET